MFDTVSEGSGRQCPAPVDDWFAVPTWREEPAPATVPVGRCLAFTGDGLAARLVAGLREAGVEVVEVVAGHGYGIDTAGRYTLRPGDRADVEKLVADLAVSGGVPARVVHAWPLLGGPAGTDVDAAWRAQELGLFAVLALAQALAGSQLVQPVHLDLVTAGTEQVTGAELTRPEHATIAGIVRVLPLELAELSVRHLDLDPGEGAAAVDACLDELLREPSGGAGDQVVLRAGRRWRRDYQPVSAAPTRPAAGLRERGVYVVTGGLGGIGLAMAEDLARRVGARLVLFGRTGLPSGGGQEDGLRRIERAGGEVLVSAADVTDEAALMRVRQAALDRFGRIDGVVHAAGVAGGGMAEVRDRAAVEQVLAPKLAGTLVLARVFGGDDLDFVVLFSSVTAVAAQIGQLDLCAAHAFVDALARSGQGFRGRVMSVDWGGWLEVGMATTGSGPVGPVAEPRPTSGAASTESSGIRPAAGVEALARLLAADLGPQVVVTPESLPGLLAQVRSPATAVRASGEPDANRGDHTLRLLDGDYVAPRTELEATLTAIWSEVLGIGQIGVTDDFFELGGDSLLGVQLIAAIRTTLGAKVPMRTLFDLPTVAQIAARIEELRGTAAATEPAEEPIPRLPRP